MVDLDEEWEGDGKEELENVEVLKGEGWDEEEEVIEGDEEEEEGEGERVGGEGGGEEV